MQVTRDTHRETIASPGILVYDAHTNGTIKPVKNWPRAYVAVNSKCVCMTLFPLCRTSQQILRDLIWRTSIVTPRAP